MEKLEAALKIQRFWRAYQATKQELTVGKSRARQQFEARTLITPEVLFTNIQKEDFRIQKSNARLMLEGQDITADSYLRFSAVYDKLTGHRHQSALLAALMSQIDARQKLAASCQALAIKTLNPGENIIIFQGHDGIGRLLSSYFRVHNAKARFHEVFIKHRYTVIVFNLQSSLLELDAVKTLLQAIGRVPGMVQVYEDTKKALLPTMLAPTVARDTHIRTFENTRKFSGGLLRQITDALINNLSTFLKPPFSKQIKHSLTEIALYDTQIALAERDCQLAANLLELLVSHLGYVLYQSQPYTEGLKDIILQKYYSKLEPKPIVGLTNCGMDSLLSAFRVARNFHHRLSGKAVVYTAIGHEYSEQSGLSELFRLIANPFQKGVESLADIDIMTANIRASNPKSSHANIGSIIESVRQVLQARSEYPLTLILDTTIELKTDIEKIQKAFAKPVARAQLNIVICRSGKKYDSLGFGMTQVGLICCWNNQSRLFRDFNHSIRQIFQRAEILTSFDGQLFLHFAHRLQPFRDSLVQTAAKHAALICKDIPSGLNINTANGLISIPTSVVIHGLNGLSTAGLDAEFLACEISQLFKIPYRASFGFLETSITELDDSDVRISIGQEPLPELYEKLYSLCKCISGGETPYFTAVNLATRLNHIYRHESYCFNKIASVLCLAHECHIRTQDEIDVRENAIVILDCLDTYFFNLRPSCCRSKLEVIQHFQAKGISNAMMHQLIQVYLELNADLCNTMDKRLYSYLLAVLPIDKQRKYQYDDRLESKRCEI